MAQFIDLVVIKMIIVKQNQILQLIRFLQEGMEVMELLHLMVTSLHGAMVRRLTEVQLLLPGTKMMEQLIQHLQLQI